MLYVFCALIGLAGIFVFALVWFGIKEFFSQERRNHTSVNCQRNKLHLKHLEHINNGR